MNDRFRIRVASVNTDVTFANGRPGDYAQVTFRVLLQDYRIDIPVYVNMNTTDDGNVIRVARSQLANLLDALANQTASWRMTDAEIRGL